jgi:hypothetical protein
MNTPTIQSASLQFREGNSDNSAGVSRPIQQTARRVHSGTADGGKEYHAAIEPDGEGYIVTFVLRPTRQHAHHRDQDTLSNLPP